MSGGFMLDAGALIAIDRGDRRMLALLEAAHRERASLSVTAPVVAQAWRDGTRQARLATFLKQREVETVAFAAVDARAVGRLAAMSRHADVVDVHVVLAAQEREQTIVTSDPSDIRRVDSRAKVVAI